MKSLELLVERIILSSRWLLVVFYLGLVAALVLWLMVRKTVLGFEIRAVGENKAAARFAGIPVDATMLKVALISGGLAGLAGVGEVAGVKGYLSADLAVSGQVYPRVDVTPFGDLPRESTYARETLSRVVQSRQ